MKNICRGVLYLTISVIIPTLFLYCSPFYYPYIWLLFFLFFLFVSLFSSRCMPELRFAITQKSVLTGSIYDGSLTQVLATLAVLVEESLTQASVHSKRFTQY